ncbi:hypothetical protein SGGMMB4_05300 [Sodalis glossinidius str. 'morsitans']|uniref:Uncharacterized protein n=1 Tax=Sodalis glossinidius (strain morsitans) TaxID=343509 RepID=A0A193QN20_SODGM|nr:hypothetical protein SGGMMB4_05300 [Sodalis glossinidius str. 'morsitans']
MPIPSDVTVISPRAIRIDLVDDLIVAGGRIVAGGIGKQARQGPYRAAAPNVVSLVKHGVRQRASPLSELKVKPGARVGIIYWRNINTAH